MPKSTPPRSIFYYKDYRLFLRTAFVALKEEQSRVSLESVARKAGISKSYLRYILEAKRHITLDVVPKIAKALRLSREERQALTYMVCRDTCRDAEAKGFFEDVLKNLASPEFQGSLREVFDKNNSNGLFNNWLGMTIHSLSKQKGFRPDANWVRSRLNGENIQVEDIHRTLQFLIKSKSLVQNEDGSWKPAAFVYDTPGPNPLEGYKIYRVGLNAMEPVTAKPEQYKPATFHMMSLSFEDENLTQVQALIHECRNSLIKVSQTTQNPKYVVFVNLNAACLAESKEPQKL